MHGPALPVVIPLLIAAILAATGGLLPAKFSTLSPFSPREVLAICIWLMHRSAGGAIVYWFGNWKPEPHGHFPVGICFMIDPIGAGMAALVALLVFVAMIFWRRISSRSSRFTMPSCWSSWPRCAGCA